MKAELPRAEAGLRPDIEEAEKHLAAVTLAMDRMQRLLGILGPVEEWMEQNPEVVPHPEYTCESERADWNQCWEAYMQAAAQ